MRPRVRYVIGTVYILDYRLWMSVQCGDGAYGGQHLHQVDKEGRRYDNAWPVWGGDSMIVRGMDRPRVCQNKSRHSRATRAAMSPLLICTTNSTTNVITITIPRKRTSQTNSRAIWRCMDSDQFYDYLRCQGSGRRVLSAHFILSGSDRPCNP